MNNIFAQTEMQTEKERENDVDSCAILLLFRCVMQQHKMLSEMLIKMDFS